MLRHRRPQLLLALLVFALGLVVHRSGWLTSLDNGLLGLCFQLRGPVPPAPEVVLVHIDSATLGQVGTGRWPNQPDLYADLIRQLSRAGAAVIALDTPALATVEWGHDRPQATRELVAAVRESGRVILPVVLQPRTELREPPPLASLARFSPGEGTLPVPISLRDGGLAAPPAALCDAAAGVGHVNIYPDSDGIIRSVPLFTCAHGKLWPSLALETVRVYRRIPPGAARLEQDVVKLAEMTYAVTPQGEMGINFDGGFGHYPGLSASDVLASANRAAAQRVRGKIVIVGLTATGLLAPWRTPIHPVMTGPEINANAIGNLLHGRELRPTANWVVLALALAGVLILGWALPTVGVARGTVVSLVAFVLLMGLMVACFAAGVWLRAGLPLFALGLTAVVLLVHGAVLADRQRAKAEASMMSRLQAIEGIGNLIVSSVDRNQLLGEIVRWVEREMDVPAVSILLLDEKRKRLHFEIASGEKGREVKAFALELGQGIAGTVALTGQPLIVQDARRDPRQAKDIAEAVEFPTNSILCVPMTLHGQVIGVIEALNKRSGPFTIYDQSLLNVIAQQAALFLESARLYSELQQRVDAATAELRSANADLATQKAKIEALVDRMESGVIATDARDRVVTWNQTAERLLGTPEAQAIGEPVLAVIKHPRLSELFAMPLTPLGGTHAEDVAITAGGQEYIVRASLALVPEADGQFGKLALLTDITQLKELDRMKTDLISFVSHELKNPLSSIKGFGQLLQRSIGEDSPNARIVRLLNHQTTRMQWLVEDFLDVTRIESGIALVMRRQPITDLPELIQSIVDMQAVTAPEHRFVVDVAPDLPPLFADRGKMEQVLVNLISNAVKYSPDGGEVRICVRCEDGHVLFSVSDEGMGISPQEAPNLFQRFRRAPGVRERVQGTGIGLFLSRHLVEAHGGSIWVEPREKGSDFRFKIPLIPPDSPTGEDASATTAETG